MTDTADFGRELDEAHKLAEMLAEKLTGIQERFDKHKQYRMLANAVLYAKFVAGNIQGWTDKE